MPVEPTHNFPDDVDPAPAEEVLYRLSSTADLYLDNAKQRQVGNDLWLLPILTKIGITPGAPALDVGCAVATNSLYLAEHGYTVTGIDSSPAMVTAAWAACRKAGLANTPKILHKDFRRWTATGGTYHLVLATAFVHLFRPPQDRSIAESVLSHVAPGGTAIVSTTVERVHSQGLRAKSDGHQDVTVAPGLERWRNHYTKETFWNLVRGAAAETFGTAHTVTRYVVKDPDRPDRSWSDIVVTRAL